MGKISQALKSRLTLAREDMKRKREFNQRIQQREREEYNRAYEAGRIKRARQEGFAAGRQKKGGGFTDTVMKYGESFSKAGEEMFGLSSMRTTKPKRTVQHKKKGTTITVNGTTIHIKRGKGQKQASKKKTPLWW